MAGGQIQSLRVFVATWNVGGQSPRKSLDLDDFLRVNDQSADIYVLGFQEIVPLNAGNVLVVEDSEPAAKWLALINHSLNRSHSFTSRVPQISSLLLFQKSSLKKVCKSFRTEKVRKLKSCNCMPVLERKSSRESCLWCPPSNVNQDDMSSEEDEDNGLNKYVTRAKHMKYSLIVGKQMVGIFLTVWMRKELVPYISHLRVSYVGRGIMGCLGNKGCISVRMCLYQTSLCFVCSHLASGEKEGDELRRNLDVIEILKNTQFPRSCRSVYSRIPEKIVDHDRVIWLGDLNYRIALSYSNAKRLLEMRDWETLFNKDQLKIEREAGRVFKGWREGKIYFAPTYKFSNNSDNYTCTLDSLDNKTKRRIPAWCDRILWHGNGIHQLSYMCGESRFSDHRPVIATFTVDVEVVGTGNHRQGSFRL